MWGDVVPSETESGKCIFSFWLGVAPETVVWSSGKHLRLEDMGLSPFPLLVTWQRSLPFSKPVSSSVKWRQYLSPRVLVKITRERDIRVLYFSTTLWFTKYQPESLQAVSDSSLRLQSQ